MRDKQCDPYIRCDECKGEIYHGEHAYLWEGNFICGECLRDKVRAMSDDELADVLGVFVHEVTL